MKIRTSLKPEFVAKKLKELGPWFYPFEFDNVRVESFRNPNALKIHESRDRCIFPFLDRYFQRRWQELTCLDIACHEGWFSFQVATRGARSVVGVDVRQERILQANFIREAGSFENTRFECRDFFSLDEARDGSFDLVFFLGIFYHLEDLVRGFRHVRKLTREVCVMEGQVIRHQGQIVTAWGNKEDLRSGPACTVLDADPNHCGPGAALAVVPSLEALQMIIRAAGFSRAHLVLPTPELEEQYVSFDRVILFAFV